VGKICILFLTERFGEEGEVGWKEGISVSYVNIGYGSLY
jgi:hypothetical protein